MRYFIQLSFDGKSYHGWQIQDNAHSVQAELNKALSTILQTSIETTGCGRTDTGVHARKFYAHFDAELNEGIPVIVHQLNCVLPPDIAIQSIFPVEANAHARFDATSRTYEYRIYQKKNPFLRDSGWFFPHPLDLDIMNQFSDELKNQKDFSCFSKSRTQTATNDCTILKAVWTLEDDFILYTISANRFLRNMVRAIVGTLVEAGRGKLDHSAWLEILKSKDRKEAGPSVPAQGLSLVDIQYPYLK